jgi:hypothetical protein
MPTFADRVRSDASYRSLARGRKLIGRERAIQERIIGLGEAEIARMLRKLKRVQEAHQLEIRQVELEAAELKGDLRTGQVKSQLDLERQRTKFLLVMMRSIRALPELLVTPFDEMRSRIFDRPLLEQADTDPSVEDDALPKARVVAGQSVAEEISDNAPALADSPLLKSDGEQPSSTNDPSDPAAEEQPPPNGNPAKTTLTRRLYDAMPERARTCVDMLEAGLTRLTPLSAALLIVAVAIATWGYGKWSRSYLEQSYAYVIGQKDALTERVVELEKDTSAFQKAREENAANLAKVASLTGQLATTNQYAADLDRDRKVSESTHKAELKTINEAHAAQLAEARANADAELKKQIQTLLSANAGLAADRDAIKEENGRLKPAAERLPGVEEALAKANDTVQRQGEQIGTLNTTLANVNAKAIAIQALLSGTISQLSDGLINTGEDYLQWHQDEFKKSFNKLYAAAPAIYQSLGYKKF